MKIEIEGKVFESSGGPPASCRGCDQFEQRVQLDHALCLALAAKGVVCADVGIWREVKEPVDVTRVTVTFDFPDRIDRDNARRLVALIIEPEAAMSERRGIALDNLIAAEIEP